jgi:hypothetical protein
MNENQNHTWVEQDCTVEHQGHKHTCGGGLVSPDRIIAYPGENGELNDWHGNAIGTWRVISSRPAIFFGHRSFWGDRYYYMRAVVNGVEYSLRGFGKGMAANGKRIMA